MHISRNPSEQIEFDWTGDPAHIMDSDTGGITDAWIFVGVLICNQYAFVEAFMNVHTNNWIKAHNHMYQFGGDITTMLVSDNHYYNQSSEDRLVYAVIEYNIPRDGRTL